MLSPKLKVYVVFFIKLSLNSNEIFFEAPVVGYTLYFDELRGGDTTSCFPTSFRVTYSSKVSVNPSLSKKVVFIFGEEFINLGGIESLGPPVGDVRLAHLTKTRRMSIEKKRLILFFILLKFNTKLDNIIFQPIGN